jgi:hypothetical protein
MSETNERHDGTRPANMLELDFAIVVARLIADAQKDPVQLRNTIYELTRRKLLDQLAHDDGRERQRIVQAMETAIAGVEVLSQRLEIGELASPSAPGRRDQPSRELTAGDETAAQHVAMLDRNDNREVWIRPPLWTAWAGAAPKSSPEVVQVNVLRARRTFLPARAFLMIGTVAVVVSGAIYLYRQSTHLQFPRAMDRSSRLPSTPNATTSPAQSVRAAPEGDRDALPDPKISEGLKSEPTVRGDNLASLVDRRPDGRQVLSMMNAGVLLFGADNGEGDRKRGAALVYSAALLGLVPARNLIVFNYPRSLTIRQLVSTSDVVHFAVDLVATHQTGADENFSVLAYFFSANGNAVAFAKALVENLSGDVRIDETLMVALTNPLSRVRGVCNAIKQIAWGDLTLDQEECSSEFRARLMTNLAARQSVDREATDRQRGLELAGKLKFEELAR